LVWLKADSVSHFFHVTGDKVNARVPSVGPGLPHRVRAAARRVGAPAVGRSRFSFVLVLTVAAVSTLGCGEATPTPPEEPGPLTITSSELPPATVDAPYEASLQATGGTPPYGWRSLIAPAGYPPGLNTSEDGVVSGTPDYPAGTYQFPIEVIDSAGERASAELTLQVVATSGLGVTSLSLEPGQAGQPYVDTLEAAGGFPPTASPGPMSLEGSRCRRTEFCREIRDPPARQVKSIRAL
jgi:hypothetical protein